MTPPRLRTLDAPRRAALGIRYAAAHTFRDGELPRVTERNCDAFRKGFIGPVTDRADLDRASGSTVTVESLDTIAEEFRTRFLPGFGEGSALVEARVREFRSRAAAELDGDIPRGIRDTFASLDGYTRSLYAEHAVPGSPMPAVHFEMAHLQIDASDAVRASCAVKDGPGPVSVVRLSVRDDSFDWRSACSVPYLLLHELFCHAYQGIEAPFAPRVVADSSCVWTEGWMDAVSLHVLRRWVEARPEGVEWCCRDRGAVDRATTFAHAVRAVPQDALPNHQRLRRMSARSAVDHMTHELGRFAVDGDPGSGGDACAAFSVALNSVHLEQAVRDRLTEVLVTALELSVDVDRDDLVAAIVLFTRTRELLPLLGELCRLGGIVDIFTEFPT